jgi:MarR family transcriptional regulator, organic hydroperoxide resistance regulator
MDSDFDKVRFFWAERLRISGPQWMLLLATAGLDEGGGVRPEAIAKRLHVNTSFVEIYTKVLEKKSFLRRSSPSDRQGQLKLSLTDKSRACLAGHDAITASFRGHRQR